MAATFGEWLKEARARQRPALRQQDIADAIGVDRSYIVKIETGRIGLPQHETRQRIHAALGTSDDELRERGIIRDAHVTATLIPLTLGGSQGTLTGMREFTPLDDATIRQVIDRAGGIVVSGPGVRIAYQPPWSDFVPEPTMVEPGLVPRVI